LPARHHSSDLLFEGFLTPRPMRTFHLSIDLDI
jgi:hypothetical protein